MSYQTAIYHDNKPMQNHYSEQVLLKVLNADNNNNTIAIDNNSDIYTRAKRHFVICNSCFWCASLYSDSMTIKCPVCNSYSNLESIPISTNESFKFNYHSGTGIVLEFSRH
jgi:hypothetical protein